MPGVADAERRTRSTQDQQDRKKEREELLRLISEGRIHEADEHQLETIRLALELNSIMENNSTRGVDPEALQEALRGAVAEVVSAMPTGYNTGGLSGSSAADPARPQVRHVSLTDISHKDSGLDISHEDTLTQSTESAADAAEKLKRLKKIKGS